MKKAMKILVPLVMAAGIIASIGWYLFEYDRDFTRDMLLSQARYQTESGNTELASWFYDLAYEFTGQDDNVAIELANQYKAEGNYTKAEYTLTNAISDKATAELYTALCQTYVEQDKLLDAVGMLKNITDPAIRAQLDAARPASPVPDYEQGFYSQYISVSLTAESGKIYFSTDAEYPSVATEPFSTPLALPVGESTICALTVGDNGLVSDPVTLRYTISGIVEPVTFTDAAMESAIRDILKVDADEIVYTNDLWPITTFTVPAEAESFEDLALMPYLEHLTMQGKDLESLRCLSPLTRLKTLDLSNCLFPASELAVLTRLPELYDLNLSDCGLSTIADLSEAHGLIYLNLSRNTLRNLEPISGMSSLSELILDHNAVNDLSALSGLKNLEKLDISYNSVTTLEPLASCIRLSWLDVSSNLLAELTAVDKLPNLKHLSLAANNLTDVSLLAACTALTELNISNNTIEDITMLSTLTALDDFNFSYNQVVELPEWPDGSVLRIIDGSHNLLESIDSLQNMTELAYVYMDYNALTSVDALADCYHLVLVNVYGNEINKPDKLTEHNIIVNYDPT